jgi:general secretion pathway protein H
MSVLRERGFTLIELLVTLMIMVLILGVAVPQFSRGMTSVQLRQSTQEIAALLRQARSIAVTQSQVAELKLNAEKHTLNSAQGGQAYQWPADIDIEALSSATPLYAEDTTIHFYPDGTASATLLTISANERSYTIEVDWLTARVRVH